MISKIQVLKGVLLALLIIEMLFFSGIAFGMNSLFPSLSDLRYFCYSTNVKNPCVDQQQYFGYLLITVIISYSLVAVPIGMFYDRFGNYKTKIIAAILVSLGCLSYAISSVATNYLAFLAALLLGAFAQTILTCNFALTSLYPSIQNLLVAIFSGSFDSSNFMMTFITLGYRSGISILASFLILTFFGLFICCTTSILIYVIEKLNNTISNNESIQQGNQPEVTNPEITDKSSNEFIEKLINERYPTLRSVLLSRQYIMQISYLTILFFRFAYFLAELNLQLNNLFPNQKVFVNSLLFNSSFVFVCAIIISPLQGLVVDGIRKSMKTTFLTCDIDKLYGNSLLCFTPSFFFTTTLALIMCILILIPTEGAIYCSFISFMLMRVILFSTNSTYILQAFPKRFFGKLFGIGVLVSGGMSFIQYGLLFDDPVKLNIVNYILIAIVSLTYIHPLVLLFKK